MFQLSLLEASRSFLILASITFVAVRVLRCTTLLSTTGTYQMISSKIVVSSLSGGPLRRWEKLLATAAFELRLAFLASQRLLLRPGFKYGCLWRAYETGISVEHAPWLIQPVHDAPTNWEGICLAVRLAEGVNKRWLCASQFEGDWNFVNIQRSG